MSDKSRSNGSRKHQYQHYKNATSSSDEKSAAEPHQVSNKAAARLGEVKQPVTATRSYPGVAAAMRHKGGVAGSTGNILDTSNSASPPGVDKSTPHIKRDGRTPGARVNKPFRSLLNLHSHKHNHSSSPAPNAMSSSASGPTASVSVNTPDFETSRTVDMSEDVFRDTFAMLSDFRQRGILCDLDLVVGSSTFPCHRAVMCCASRFLRGLYTGHSSRDARTSLSVVELKELDAAAVDQLIQFAYSGVLEITVDNVQPLLTAASYLQMEAVTQACGDFTKKQLHPWNCIAMGKYAEQQGRSDLQLLVDLYMIEHFNQVIESDDFVSISPQRLADVIGSDDLNVDSEIQVYEAVLRWVKHDIEGRKQALAPLLAKVKLPLLPASYLTQVVEIDDLIHADMECRDYVDEAKSYQLSLAGLTPLQRPYDKMVPRRSCSGVLFCVGGRGASGDPFRSIECYDFRNNKWFTIAEMSTRRRHVGVVSSEGKLYAIGGHDGAEHLNSAEVFDPVTNRWKSIAPMSTYRRGLAVTSLGNVLYAIGGLDDTACFCTVERYDPSADCWSEVAAMNVPRGGVGVAVLKNCIYAIGGNDGVSSLSSCERYDPILNKWVMIAPMNKRRAGAGVAVLHGRLYAAGGFDDNAPLESTEVYDSETNEWSYVMSMLSPRGGVGVAQLGGFLFAVGGHDGTNYLNSVEAYNPISDSWEDRSSLLVCRAGSGITSGLFHVAAQKKLKKLKSHYMSVGAL